MLSQLIPKEVKKEPASQVVESQPSVVEKVVAEK
jgi:hypothetical protein